jgi:phage baseplate assembly protein W
LRPALKCDVTVFAERGSRENSRPQTLFSPKGICTKFPTFKRLPQKPIMANYNIPLRLSDAMEGKSLPSCDLESSIQNNLALIITTKFGEHRSDPSFGCEIWNLDFELIVSARLWEEKLRQSLLKSITVHEQRLSGVEINVIISDVEKFNVLKQFIEIKKRVDIRITGLIKKTGESFSFHTNLFLSPLSVD